MVSNKATPFFEPPELFEEIDAFSDIVETDEGEMNNTGDVESVSSEAQPSEELFEDPDFPANSFSLYSTADKSSTEVEWKRPGEIVEHPMFISEGLSRFDVRQGTLGNCWFMSACASLATVPELFEQVVPKHNVEFKDANYRGKFHFRFWQYGQWVEVVVDDRLPVNDDGHLFYGDSSTEDEFWCALLEKAYAKLHGSYESLKGGIAMESLVDLTGGIAECFMLNDLEPSKLFGLVESNLKRRCLITTGTFKHSSLKDVNLVQLHEYTVTNVVEVVGENNVQLICIRNPHGYDEWNASWSDSSPMWKTVTDEKMSELNIVKDDGEFWMDIVDFMRYFGDITMCHQPPMGCDVRQNRAEGCWATASQHGAWVGGSTAGGSEKGNLWRNPQYLITLEEHSSNVVDNDDTNHTGEKCEIIVGLMQKHQRATGRKDAPMSFSIFSVPEDTDLTQRPLPKSFFDDAVPIIEDPALERAREIVHRVSLPAGKYVLVPYTWKPQQEAEFFIRVFSLAAITMECIDQTPNRVGQTPSELDSERTRLSKDMLYEIFMMGCNELQTILQRVFDLKLGEQDGQGWLHHGQLLPPKGDVSIATNGDGLK